ncbi:MAG: hypothetical protein LBC11_02310 [Puniceicoccales bacterium]|jgi:hypothetical protein|nr:hypothetical protein [Puniceicoccales bacterium]
MDEKTTLRLTSLFGTIDDLCKEKKIEQKERRGRKGGVKFWPYRLWFNLSKCKDFRHSRKLEKSSVANGHISLAPFR